MNCTEPFPKATTQTVHPFLPNQTMIANHPVLHTSQPRNKPCQACKSKRSRCYFLYKGDKRCRLCAEKGWNCIPGQRAQPVSTTDDFNQHEPDFVITNSQLSYGQEFSHQQLPISLSDKAPQHRLQGEATIPGNFGQDSFEMPEPSGFGAPMDIDMSGLMPSLPPTHPTQSTQGFERVEGPALASEPITERLESSKTFERKIQPLHEAARNGKYDTVKFLIDHAKFINKPLDLDLYDRNGKTALIVAAAEGHFSVCNLLVRSGANVKRKTLMSGVSPLHLAAYKGYLTIVNLLLDNHADIDQLDEEGQSALHYAVASEKVNIVSVLLNRRAAVNICNKKQRMQPLHGAALAGNIAILGLILSHVNDVDVTIEGGFTALHAAAQEGHTEAIGLLRAKQCNLNTTSSESGLQAIHMALANEKVEAAKALLDMGAEFDRASAEGMTPLCLASKLNDLPLVLDLIRKGSKVNPKSRGDQSPLHYACIRGNIDIVNALLVAGARREEVDVREETPLCKAAQGGHFDICEKLLVLGANLKVRNTEGWSPLHMAAQSGNADVVRLMLQHSADVHAQEKAGTTAVWIAAQHGYATMLELLLKEGARVDVTWTAEHRNPLQQASQNGHLTSVKLLMTRMSETHLDAVDADGRTAFELAARSGNVGITKLLLANGASKELVTKSNSQALHHAAASSNVEMVQMLLDIGAPRNAPDEFGKTPLWYAVNGSSTEVVKKLLEAGCDPRQADKDNGIQPLHLAAYKGNQENIIALINAGADVNCASNSGRTPLYMAAESGQEASVRSLLTLNASVAGRPDIDKRQPLHQAAQNGHVTICQILLRAGAEVNAADDNGVTPIMLASMNDQFLTLQILLREKADVNMEAIDGDTAITLASREGHFSIIRELATAGAPLQ